MHILVVDDEESQRDLLAGFLGKKGFTVRTAASGKDAIEVNANTGFDLAILDLKMPELDGIETIQRMKEIDPETYFVILTGYGTVESAVQAMKLGAYDYLSKPVNLDELELIIGRIQNEKDMHEEIQLLRDQVEEKFKFDSFIAESPKMQEIMSLISRVARSDSNILILGESGTGKDMVARLIHSASLRKKGRFIAISCAALPETLLESELFGYERGAFSGAEKRRIGKFELAHGGTIFLDEVGDIPISTQVKLLRVLQEFSFERLGGNVPIRVDVRLVTATNQDLKKKIAGGAFREDLYYRLNVITLTLPPLRERKEDIKPLADHFVEKFGKKCSREIKGISGIALDKLMRYEWPGNVRELENVMERAVVLCRGSYVDVGDLPLETGPVLSDRGGGSLADVERNHIMAVLKQTDWNLSEAAGRLGIHRNTLRTKIREYRIERNTR
ncbi:MAG: sigma-54-dependent Fis family transcriptional regulator [candidate division WOR-3 bacterium]|nr:MAG: sigma-54-dependent Fis family transcriptional regulator [candidate division WOR-3 bacterium]